MSNNYCIALQPICDRAMRHVGDELLYRSSAQATSAYIADDEAVMATARVCNIAFYEVGLTKLVGQRKIFFNAPRDWLLNPELLPPNSDQVVIEVLEDVSADSEIVDALIEIKKRGYTVALDDFVLNDNTKDLLNIATVVKLDNWQDISLEMVQFYKAQGVELLAEKVEEVEDFEHLKALGFDYFQGYFYAKPQMHAETSRERSSNQEIQIRILAALKREGVDYQQLERMIIQDPHLTFMLLKYTNAAFYARFTKAVTITQAITALGMLRVKAIVMTVMLANNGPASRLLLPQVLTRAAMCQQLAEDSYSIDPDMAFTVGVLSKMDLIMNMPMTELLLQLSSSQEEREALLHRKGELGHLLATVEAFENVDSAGLMNKSLDRLNQLWLRSRIWVEDILQLTVYSN